MATNLKTRINDRWSLRLRIKRPSRTSRIVLLVLAVVQTVLLFLTASTSESGRLYGCASPCGTVALPTTPFLAVLMGIAIFVLPAVIGALCDTWPGALTLATLPWWRSSCWPPKGTPPPATSRRPSGWMPRTSCRCCFRSCYSLRSGASAGWRARPCASRKTLNGCPHRCILCPRAAITSARGQPHERSSDTSEARGRARSAHDRDPGRAGWHSQYLGPGSGRAGVCGGAARRAAGSGDSRGRGGQPHRAHAWHSHQARDRAATAAERPYGSCAAGQGPHAHRRGWRDAQ